MPEFEKLRRCLAGLSSPPADSRAPTPLDLGFTPEQITPLSAEQLSTWGHALQKWRKILDDYDKSGKKSAERRRKHQRWKIEVENLSRTLEYSWQTLRSWEGGKRIPMAPYVYDGSVGADSKDWERKKVRSVDPFWDWLEQIVTWLSGPHAGLRLREALRPYWEGTEQQETRRFLSKVLERVKALPLKKKSGDLSNEEIEIALIDAFASIPEKLREDFLFDGAGDYCMWRSLKQITSTLQRLVSSSLLPAGALVGSSAALTALDGAKTPVPAWLLAPCASAMLKARIQLIKGLHNEHTQASYDELLEFLGQYHELPLDKEALYSDESLSAIRGFLDAGVYHEDMSWAIEKLSGCSALAEKALSPRPFRGLISALNRAGFDIEEWSPLNSSNLYDVVRLVTERGSTDIVSAFAMWFSALDSRALDTGLAKWAWNSLCDSLVLEGINTSLRRQLSEWADPPIDEKHVDSTVVELPDEIRHWVSRLGYYQRMCGKQVALPQSVLKILDARRREDREVFYLREAQTCGLADDRMMARLDLLEKRQRKGQTVPERRVLKKLQEACAHTALDAVRLLLRDEARRVWRQLLEQEPAKHLSEGQVVSIAAWAVGLDKPSLFRVRELLYIWDEAGLPYRKKLSLNTPWIKAAEERIDIDAWIAPRPFDTIIDGLPVQIGIAADPYRTLLMGTYFETCLSLDDFNNKAVLANAYDANKAVVFALDAQGQVLARKLVCINAKFKLIGYRTYVQGNQVITELQQQKCCALIDAFCGRWARDAGLKLAFFGAPARVSGLFWYNDGPTLWLPIAIRAWANSSIAQPDIEGLGEAKLTPAVEAALISRQSQCFELLHALGIWQSPNADESVDLSSLTGLAEETLAILARDQGDSDMARLMLEEAITQGGKLEAMISAATLNKTDEIAEHATVLGRLGRNESQWAIEVHKLVNANPASSLCEHYSYLDYTKDDIDRLLLSCLGSNSGIEVSMLHDAILGKEPFGEYVSHALIANEILADLGKSLPEKVVSETLQRSPDYAYLMSFNMSPLKFSTIEGIANADLGIPRQDSEMAAIFAAMGNALGQAEKLSGVKHRKSIAASAKYLKHASTKNPLALLVLALSFGNIYRDFIRKIVLDAPTEPAHMLALLINEGAGAEKILAPFLADDASKERFGEYTEFMLDHGTMENFNWTDLDFSSHHEDSQFRLIMFYNLYKCLDQNLFCITELAALLSSYDFVRFLSFRDHSDHSDVNMTGFAIKIARLIRRSDGKHTPVLVESLLSFLEHRSMLRHWGWSKDDAEFGHFELMLGKLTNGKLWLDLSDDRDIPMISGQICDRPGVWELLLDEAGEPLPILEKVDWASSDEISLPIDPKQASRIVQWLSENVSAENLSRAIKPVTEIQKLLVKSHIGRLGE